MLRLEKGEAIETVLSTVGDGVNFQQATVGAIAPI
jgi:hypothetical protein